MQLPPRILGALALVFGCPGLAAVPGTASETRLHVTAAQLFAIADQAIERGDLGVARRAYAALMDDPSSDVRLEARFRLAMLEGKVGNLVRAATLLRQIVDERPSAARARLELAGILDRLGDKEAAWREVRAVQASGLPPAVARLVDRYSAALRAQRPFGASFGIALAPDSNINRATRSDTLGTVLGDFDISKDAKARSGIGLALSGQAYRRFALSSHANLLMRLSAFANLYRRKDFNDIAGDFAFGPELTLGRDRVQVEVGATQRWFGQKPFLRSARLAATVSHPMGSRTLLRVNGSAAIIDNQMNDFQDGEAYSLLVGVERALSATTGVAARFGIDRQSLNGPGYSTTGWRAGLTGWQDLGRATLTADAELGRLHADERLLLFPDRRSDRSWRLSLGATFRQVQVRGFAPVVRFSIDRNKSSIAFYDYRRTRTEVGVERAF